MEELTGSAAAICLEAQREGIALQLVAVRLGRDLNVALFGGDRAHIGAVALSQARPSLSGDGSLSSTTSVLALPGHKEDDLAKGLAARLARTLGGTICVACGIHVDGIDGAGLALVAELTEQLTLALLARLEGGPMAVGGIPRG